MLTNSEAKTVGASPEQEPLDLLTPLSDLHDDMDGLQSLMEVYEREVAHVEIARLAREGMDCTEYMKDPLGSLWSLGEGKALQFMITSHRRHLACLGALVEQQEALSDRTPPEKDSDHYEVVKGRLRRCMEAWRDNDGSQDTGATLRALDGLNPGSLEVAIGKVIISVGTEIHNELTHPIPCTRLNAQAALAGLEWFGLREFYDECFNKAEAVS
jgi:hypothetical protein